MTTTLFENTSDDRVKDQRPLTILAIDPSTDITGVALVTIDGLGAVRVPASAAFDGFVLSGQPKSRTGLRNRLDRITSIRGEVSRWIAAQNVVLDGVAYEQQTERGHASTEALNMASGAILTITALKGIELYGIARVSGCAAVGASSVYREPAGKTSAEQAAKKKRLKQAVITGVNNLCGLNLQPDQDAEADAVSVGLAAAHRVLAEIKKVEKGKAQTKMTLRKAPVRKAKVA